MFPFTVRGKVNLGPRKDFHLSTASLEERITRRLIDPSRSRAPGKERGPTGQNRKPIVGEVSRLLNMGFLSAVKVRSIQILTRRDCLIAEYSMDVTITTIICVVLIPMVLGTALIANSSMSPAAAIALVALLVVFTWGLDTWMLVMLVRHEIRQIASGIKSVILKTDVFSIESHHLLLDPEDLLAIAYYYERNDLVKRSTAYFDYLITRHPETEEGGLASQRLVDLEGRHSRPRGPGDDGVSGEKERPRRRFLRPKPKDEVPPPGNSTRARSAEGKQAEDKPERGLRKLLSLPRALRLRKEKKSSDGADERKNSQGGRELHWPARKKSREEKRAARHSRRVAKRASGRASPSFDQTDDSKWWKRVIERRSREERIAFRRQRRLEQSRPGGSLSSAGEGGKRSWRNRVYSWISRDERKARKREKRWNQGPPAPVPARRTVHGERKKRVLTAPWIKAREERLSRQREERVSGRVVKHS